jgi:hypothetical protein
MFNRYDSNGEKTEASYAETKEDFVRLNKMLLENYIINASGGTVSLENLYLLDNGRIMGLPPELDELINSMEPIHLGETRQYREKEASDVYDNAKANGCGIIINSADALKAFNEGNKEEFVKIAVDWMFQQNDKLTDIKSELTNILRKGVNNIPDMTTSMVLGSNSLVFV